MAENMRAKPSGDDASGASGTPPAFWDAAPSPPAGVEPSAAGTSAAAPSGSDAIAASAMITVFGLARADTGEHALLDHPLEFGDSAMFEALCALARNVRLEPFARARRGDAAGAGDRIGEAMADMIEPQRQLARIAERGPAGHARGH